MRPEVKRWFKIIFCSLMVVFSVSIGFSTWIVPGEGDDVTSGSVKPSESTKIPCAYIDNDDKTLYTIEDALDKARSDSGANTVYVLPGTNPFIERSCVIDTLDTLCVPYSITFDDKGNKVYNWKKFDNQVGGFADESKSKVNTNRKNIITIKSGVTLTNKGTLQLGGEMGSPGAALSGQTNGSYCEIQMEPKSNIASTGELYCFGYIKETRFIDVENEYEREAIVDVSGGTIHIPLVIHDFKGGTITVSRFKKGNQSPFEVIDMVNVQALFRLHNPASVQAYTDLYAGNQHNTTNFKIFSPSDSLLNFETGAYLEAKYINEGYWETDSKTGVTYSYTTSYNYGLTDDGTENVAKQFKVHTKVSLYGNVSFGTMSMDIDPLGTGSITIATNEIYFPVSFRQEFHIYGNFSSKYKIQLMGGCYVYVEEGASFSNSANFLGYGDDVKYIDSDKIGSEDHFIANPYPKYFIGKKSKLFLKGTYKQDKGGFAVYCYPLTQKSLLDLSSASNLEFVVNENGYKTLDETIDKVSFVLKPLTTIIERITCGASGPLYTIKENGNLGKYRYSSNLSSDNYYWSTSSELKLCDIVIKSDGIRTEPGTSQNFNLSVETYPSDIAIKSYKWEITKQQVIDGAYCNKTPGDASLSYSLGKNCVVKLPASICSKAWNHLHDPHNFTYTIKVTVIDEFSNSLSQTIELVSTRKA